MRQHQSFSVPEVTTNSSSTPTVSRMNSPRSDQVYQKGVGDCSVRAPTTNRTCPAILRAKSSAVQVGRGRHVTGGQRSTVTFLRPEDDVAAEVVANHHRNENKTNQSKSTHTDWSMKIQLPQPTLGHLHTDCARGTK